MTLARARELLLVVAGGRELPADQGQDLLEYVLRLEQERDEEQRRRCYLEREIGVKETAAAARSSW